MIGYRILPCLVSLLGLGSATALQAAVTVGPEIDLDPPHYRPAPGTQNSPTMAFDGSNYLVVWMDERVEDRYTVMATRVSAAGQVLDAGGIVVTSHQFIQSTPKVAFDGANFVVVWHDRRQGFWGHVSAARVTPQGILLDPDPVHITQGGTPNAPAIACDSGGCLVTWQESDHIEGLRIGASLAPVNETGPLTISEGSSDAKPELAFDGTDYLVVWQDGNYIHGRRVSTAGNMVDEVTRIGGGESPPGFSRVSAQVAYGGGIYLVVWKETPLEANYGPMVSGAYFDPADGSVRRPYWNDINDDGGTGDPAVAFDGSAFLVTWSDGRASFTDIYAAWVGTDSSVMIIAGQDFRVLEADHDQLQPAVACSTTDCLLTWADERNYPWDNIFDLYGARLDNTTTLDSTGFVVAQSAGAQVTPAAAFTGGTYLVAWSDSRAPYNWPIYATRVDDSGDPIDAEAIEIDGANSRHSLPAVASDGTNFLVVWEDHAAPAVQNVRFRRLSAAGALLDAAAIRASLAPGASRRPDVTYGGNHYLIVWDDNSPTGRTAIYGTLVTTGGDVVGEEPIEICDQPGWHHRAAVAFGGGDLFFVVWINAEDNTVSGSRVDLLGGVIDATPVPLSGAHHPNREIPPDVACYQDLCLVVWVDSSGQDLYGTRIRLSDASIDDSNGISIAAGADRHSAPRAVHDGRRFVVAWQQQQQQGEDDLHFTYVGSDGQVSANGETISAQPLAESGVTLAAGANGRLLAAYSRFDPDATYGVIRARARMVSGDLAAQGDGCAETSNCQANLHCVDGVCCNTECGGGVDSDCLACSQAAGAASNGTCQTADQGTICRSADNSCDQLEVCDGQTNVCPEDQTQPDHSPCPGGECLSGFCLAPDAGTSSDAAPTADATALDGATAADHWATGDATADVDSTVSSDAGTGVDQGRRDTSLPDAGTPDASTSDTGRTDTGRTDTGRTDTGRTDTDRTDASGPDSIGVDASAPDSGLNDRKSANDITYDDGTHTVSCGCSSTHSNGHSLFIMLCTLAGLVFRYRRL